MDHNHGDKMSNFDSLKDRVLGDYSNGAGISVSTNLDTKSVLEDNPYFDKNKTYNKEELEEFKKFFSH